MVVAAAYLGGGGGAPAGYSLLKSDLDMRGSHVLAHSLYSCVSRWDENGSNDGGTVGS